MWPKWWRKGHSLVMWDKPSSKPWQWNHSFWSLEVSNCCCYSILTCIADNSCLFVVRELQVLSSLVCLLLDSCNLSVNFRNYRRLYFRRQRPMRIQQRIINRFQILVQCHNYRTNTVTCASTCEPHPQFGYLISWFDCHPRKKRNFIPHGVYDAYGNTMSDHKHHILVILHV